MTATSAPTTPVGNGDPFIRHTRSRIASLSNKNREILEHINKLHQSQSSSLDALNSRLESMSYLSFTGSSESDAGSVTNGYKGKRRSNIRQTRGSRASSLSEEGKVSPDQESSDNNNYDKDGKKPVRDIRALLNRSLSTVEETPKPRNGQAKDAAAKLAADELDWKYLSGDNNQSEPDTDDGGTPSSFEERYEREDKVANGKRFKDIPSLTIDTTAAQTAVTKTARRNNKSVGKANASPLTPLSSDEEFDFASAHMPMAPSLAERSPYRTTHTQDKQAVTMDNFADVAASLHASRGQGSRPSSFIYSMDEVIEEEFGEAAEIASELGDYSDTARSRTSAYRNLRSKSLALANARKRSMSATNPTMNFDYNLPEMSRPAKGSARSHGGEFPFSNGEIFDDSSSVISSDSFLEELMSLKTRVQRLEAPESVAGDRERAVSPRLAMRASRPNEATVSPSRSRIIPTSIPDASVDRRSRRRRASHETEDSALSFGGRSPSSSSIAGSVSNSSSRVSSSTQHQRHLQSAFDLFDRAWAPSSQPADDASPPATHTMGVVVSTTLSLNQKLRSLAMHTELDLGPLEKPVMLLLKSSDEQVRSLTECLLSLTQKKNGPSKGAPEKTDNLSIPRLQIDQSSDRAISPAPSFRANSPLPGATTPSTATTEPQQAQSEKPQSDTLPVSPPPDPPSSGQYNLPPPSSRFSRGSRPPSRTPSRTPSRAVSPSPSVASRRDRDYDDYQREEYSRPSTPRVDHQRRSSRGLSISSISSAGGNYDRTSAPYDARSDRERSGSPPSPPGSTHQDSSGSQRTYRERDSHSVRSHERPSRDQSYDQSNLEIPPRSSSRGSARGGDDEPVPHHRRAFSVRDEPVRSRPPSRSSHLRSEPERLDTGALERRHTIGERSRDSRRSLQPPTRVDSPRPAERTYDSTRSERLSRLSNSARDSFDGSRSERGSDRGTLRREISSSASERAYRRRSAFYDSVSTATYDEVNRRRSALIESPVTFDESDRN